MPGYNRRVDVLRGSPTRRIDEVRERLAREGRDVILLSTGQPGVPPPRWVREWLAGRLLEEGMRLYSYTPSPGTLGLREAIAGDLREYGGVEVSPEEIVVTAGGQEAMYSVLRVILEPRDKVVVLDPMYFGYWPLLELLGAETVVYRTRPGYEVDAEELSSLIVESRPKAVVLVNPDNPTGRVLDAQALRGIAEAVVEAGSWLLVDEAYRTLVYEGSYTSPWRWAPENTVGVGTFSKDPGIPGWRLGYVYAPRWLASKVKLYSEEVVYCPPSIAQALVEAYLRDREARRRHMEYLHRVYGSRLQALLEAVKSYLPRAIPSRARGGMFVLLDLSAYLEEAGIGVEELAERLLVEEQVAVVPGTYFGSTAEKAVRISFAAETPERIREGVRRLAGLLERLSG